MKGRLVVTGGQATEWTEQRVADFLDEMALEHGMTGGNGMIEVSPVIFGLLQAGYLMGPGKNGWTIRNMPVVIWKNAPMGYLAAHINEDVYQTSLNVKGMIRDNENERDQESVQ